MRRDTMVLAHAMLIAIANRMDEDITHADERGHDEERERIIETQARVDEAADAIWRLLGEELWAAPCLVTLRDVFPQSHGIDAIIDHIRALHPEYHAACLSPAPDETP